MITKIQDYGDKTLWEVISDSLKEEGFNVYPEAFHQGGAFEPYVVIKQDGGSQVGSLSSQYIYYMVMLYVNKNQYTYLDRFEREVEKVLEEKVMPMIMPTGLVNSDYYDDNLDAHMRYMTYRSVRRNKLL